MKRRILILSGLATSLIGLTAPFASADPSAPETAPIQALDAALIATMKAGSANQSFVQRFNALKPVVEQVYDLPKILSASVGIFWSQIPAAQQSALQSLFTAYTVATYVNSFDHFAGQSFQIQPNIRSIGAQRIVPTILIGAGGKKTRLDYVMSPSGGGWKIADVLFDGTISKVATQRSDFSSLVSPGDAKPLIDALRTKIAALSGGALKGG